MSGEIKKEIELKIAYVLFLDIVGYSKLAADDQRRVVETLNDVVRGTRAYREAEANARLIKLPTGDGMALVFYDRPEQPADCALEISRALQRHPQLRLRMGIHSGPVSGLIDVNGQANVAGAGINFAQRVMDCGDGGHILLSKHAAEDLEHYSHWQPFLHDLGECRVKHGVRVGVVNLYRDELGNRARPAKFRAMRRRRMKGIALSLLLLGALAAAAVIFFHQRPAPAIPEKSIAVLPFENLSEDKGNAYFAAGIQDEILTRLANLRALKVISRTSTEKYQSHPPNLKTVGSELGVANILEGSVQKLANDVHINVQLIKATSDDHIWAQSYDRTLDHAFAVEGEVAQTVAHSLQVALLPAQIEKLHALPTQNTAAYDFYLKGQYAIDQGWKVPGDYQKAFDPAITAFEEAIRLDPQFALAFAGLGEAQLLKESFGHKDGGTTRRPELLVSARQSIDRALRLQPDLPAAHLVLGLLDTAHGQSAAGLHEFQTVLSQDPHNSAALLNLGTVANDQAHPEQAIEFLTKALEWDPRNFRLLRNLAIAYITRREYKRAEEFDARAVFLNPDDDIDALNLVDDLIQDAGDLGAAQHVLDSLHANHPAGQPLTPGVASTQLTIFLDRRDFAAAKKYADDLPAGSWQTDWQKPLTLGDIDQRLGDEEGAHAQFEKARALLLQALPGNPNEAQLHADLSIASAGLGLSDEALREAQRAVALQPVAKDPRSGGQWLANLAKVEALLGHPGDAVTALEQIFATPNTGEVLSLWELRIDPTWDPLRNEPRFRKLIDSPPASPNE